jgi:hypothetical protein
MDAAVLAALLAASLFPTQARASMPGASAVAIAGRKVFAASDDGKGVVFARGKAGRLHPIATFEAGPHPSKIAVADLNGDGKPDLVISNHERKFVTVLLGPDYANPKPVSVDVTPHVHAAAVSDLDGDGKPDLVVNDMGGRRVVVLWGNGDGTFSGSAAQATGSKGYAYNNVAVSGSEIFVPTWPQPQLAVLRADKRVLSQVALLDLPNPSFFAAAADFDGDGKPDIAVATYSGATVDPSRDGLVFFSGGRPPAHSFDAGPAPSSLATGDIDGDGIADLAVCDLGGAVTILLGGKGGLHPGATLPVRQPQSIALGDLDGDGKADLAVAAGDEVIVFLTR